MKRVFSLIFIVVSILFINNCTVKDNTKMSQLEKSLILYILNNQNGKTTPVTSNCNGVSLTIDSPTQDISVSRIVEVKATANKVVQGLYYHIYHRDTLGGNYYIDNSEQFLSTSISYSSVTLGSPTDGIGHQYGIYVSINEILTAKDINGQTTPPSSVCTANKVTVTRTQ